MVRIPTGDRQIRIGVEVKDERAPLDVVSIEQLGAKLSKLDLDRGCVVAAAFTNEARREATRWGLELREIAETSRPDWFLPPAMNLVHQEIEPLACTIVYGGDANIDGVTVGVEDLHLFIPGREPQSVADIVLSEGIRASYRAELDSLKDGDVFNLNIEMSLPEGSHVKAPTGIFPVPKLIHATYRTHKKIEPMPVHSYGMKNSTALSGVSEVAGKQITFVGSDQDDGKRKISITVVDAFPKQVRLNPSS